MLPSGVTIRWKATPNPVFDGDLRAQEPTVPVCFITPETSQAISDALNNDRFEYVTSARPTEERPAISYTKDQFAFERTEGITRWIFEGASPNPQLGLAPFEFQSERAISAVSVIQTEKGVQLEIHHPTFKSGRHDYHMPYHFGHELVKITNLQEDNPQSINTT